MARRKGPKCRADEQKFTVLRVNGDDNDTHAGRSFEAALRLAQPDRGSRVDVLKVCASDAAEARLLAGKTGTGAARFFNSQLIRTFRYKGR